MRQVTGRSSSSSESKASIRLASGGRFFSISTLGNLISNEDIVVCVDTARVTLIPQAMATQISAEEALSITGQTICEDETAIYSQTVGNTVAAIAISSSCYQSLVSQVGRQLSFTTPLLSISHRGEQCLALEIVDNICYLRLYYPTLKVAEAFEFTSNEELIFYITNILTASNTPTDIPIYIIGAKEQVKALKKYYKVICE